MRRLKKTYIFLLIILFSTLVYGDKCNALQNIDVFKELLKTTNNQVIEIGLKVEYKTNNNGESECRELLNNLNLNLNSNVLINNNKSFCVEFTKENFSGYIESSLSEGYNVIVLAITKETKDNDLNDIEKNVRLVLKGENAKPRFFKYVKAKLEEHDLATINQKLLKEMESEGAYNIDSLKISNGYSTVANTNRFNPEISDGKLIDINYVLCNYSTGDYILIGTPEIIASY